MVDQIKEVPVSEDAPGTSIQTRLILAFSLLLGLMVAVCAISLIRINVLTSSMLDFANTQTRLTFLAQRTNQHAQDAAMQLLRLLQTPDRAERVPLYHAMDEALAASDAAVGGLDRAATEQATKTETDKVMKRRMDYGEQFQDTVELIEIEGIAKAKQHFLTHTDPALKALLRDTQALVDKQREKMLIEVEQLEREAKQAHLLILIIGAASFLVGGILAMLISRSIVNPVQEAVRSAGAIARGDYCCDIPIGRSKEMGKLLQSLGILRDSIASREEKILRLAYEDTLTELPNRTRFLETLNAALSNRSGALVLLDIDRFAAINNALGHPVGDRLLQEFARRMTTLIPDTSFVARLGADEFALIFFDADKAAMTAHASRFLEQLRQPLLIDDQRLDVDASLGIVFFPQDGATPTALLRRADLAVGMAKRRHDGFAFGTDLADRPAHEELSLIGEMREALVRNEFVAFFQPKMEFASGRIKSAEALLRWKHPVKGLVPPGRFIPFAEQTGFIREITPWLINHVVRQAVEWHRQGLEIVVSVNLSTLDLATPALVEDVKKLLVDTGLPPHLLCLEITESALMDNPDDALRHLENLAALGLKLSIDDYGSGQASLAYVQRLPVNELKIDRAFVDKVDRLPKNAAIVRSTILLCRELGLSVVAEGAETAEELDWLAHNKCDVVQGYGIAKPMPPEDFIPWVQQYRRS